jgi:hypothetical protein
MRMTSLTDDAQGLLGELLTVEGDTVAGPRRQR